MRYLNDPTVAEFLAGPRLRLLVFGTGTDLSSQVFGRQLTEFDDLTGTPTQIGRTTRRHRPWWKPRPLALGMPPPWERLGEAGIIGSVISHSPSGTSCLANSSTHCLYRASCAPTETSPMT
ncbi:hypothetical protein GCM10009853_014870 [Glycomyces scopariae]